MTQAVTLRTQAGATATGLPPSFSVLVKERKRLALGLSSIVLFTYYLFVYVVAFRPDWLARRIGNSSISIGLPLAGAIFIVFTLLTAYYAHRANHRFDELTRLAIEEMKG